VEQIPELVGDVSIARHPHLALADQCLGVATQQANHGQWRASQCCRRGRLAGRLARRLANGRYAHLAILGREPDAQRRAIEPHIQGLAIQCRCHGLGR